MKYFALALSLVFVIAGSPSARAQKIVVPEEIKKKCGSRNFEERARLAVARFTNSVSGKNSANTDNFSSMLSNALSETDCFRMLSMWKDSTDFTDTEKGSDVKPQLVITGEITEYSHAVTETKVFMSRKTKITAHIGFILQVKDPETRDIYFSKSFNQEGSSENKTMELSDARLPGGQRIPLPGGDLKTETNEPISRAYFDALEKGIIAAIGYLVDSSERVYRLARNSTNPGGNRLLLVIKQINYMQLREAETLLKNAAGVLRTEKKLTGDNGDIVVFHNSNTDAITSLLLDKMNMLEVLNFGEKEVTLKVKK
ncbi:MAG: hypothetical protein JNM68_14275 [Dinghuibacter sp.]|nr:hypothetical protein [Dinghuibacter sp.]